MQVEVKTQEVKKKATNKISKFEEGFRDSLKRQIDENEQIE